MAFVPHLSSGHWQHSKLNLDLKGRFFVFGGTASERNQSRSMTWEVSAPYWSGPFA